MTSEPAATVTAVTTTQVSDGSSTVAAGNGSANTSTSTPTSSSRSSSSAGPKATQNGGTVLDQAGTSGGPSSILQAESLWGMSVGLGCLVVGLVWLW